MRKHSGPRMNHHIRVPEIRVIGSDGAQLGIMTPRDALGLAHEEGLDLVEISPQAKPPVCKIMDYGKHKYEQKKKEQENKKKQVKISVKEIKLRPNTDTHDLEFKMKHVRRFLDDGDKVKVTIQFRGREMMFKDRGKEILLGLVEDLKEVAEAENNPKMEGRTMSVVMAPLKS